MSRSGRWRHSSRTPDNPRTCQGDAPSRGAARCGYSPFPAHRESAGRPLHRRSACGPSDPCRRPPDRRPPWWSLPAARSPGVPRRYSWGCGSNPMLRGGASSPHPARHSPPCRTGRKRCWGGSAWQSRRDRPSHATRRPHQEWQTCRFSASVQPRDNCISPDWTPGRRWTQAGEPPTCRQTAWPWGRPFYPTRRIRPPETPVWHWAPTRQSAT